MVWFEGEKLLYGGCLIKSTEATNLGYIEESNLEAWPETISGLINRFPDVQFVIPGHQDWTSNKAMQHTLNLLKAHQSK